MQRELIVEKLREHGCRITKQRLALLDIILENECSCCKEIYYKALKSGHKVGSATVYRMLNTLEEIGAINRKNLYRIAYAEHCNKKDACTIELEDGSIHHLTAKEWNLVLKRGLCELGYEDVSGVVSVSIQSCECGNERY